MEYVFNNATRCPGLFIQPSITLCGELYPAAIFSPPLSSGIPYSLKIDVLSVPSGLVCENFMEISFALCIAALFKSLLVCTSGSPCFALSTFVNLKISAANCSSVNVGAGVISGLSSSSPDGT